jgi:hypothetical protein
MPLLSIDSKASDKLLESALGMKVPDAEISKRFFSFSGHLG